uniref:E4 protein n=1 Tax=Human papillomavirus TaxID=10566 RepID=A0A385PJ74_9PAPI|nr:MAG: E4 protein [Human papillomavirus]
MKLFLPLLPVPQQGPFPGLQTRLIDPPRTPHPQRKHPHLESGGTKPTRTPPASRPPRPALDFDYDEENNKENVPPPEPDEEEEISVVSHLLKKWEVDLERLKEKIFRELEDCKQRLGIRH